jgi:hypothetical protein
MNNKNIINKYIRKNEKFFYFLNIRIQILLNLGKFSCENRILTLALREGLLLCADDVRTVSTDLNYISHYIEEFNMFELFNFDQSLVGEIDKVMMNMKF